MAQGTTNFLQRKKQSQLPEDVYDCDMNNTYAKRLHHQQMKGISLSNFYHNVYASKQPPPSNEKVTVVESNPDKIMEIQENVENEGENLFSFKKSSLDQSLKGMNDNAKTFYDKSSFSESFQNMESLSSTSINSDNSFSSPKQSGLSNSCSSDRYIPSRGGSGWQTRFSMLPDPRATYSKAQRYRDTYSSSNAHEGSREMYTAYSSLLRNELLDSNIEGIKMQCEEKRVNAVNDSMNLFHFGSPKQQKVNIESEVPYSLSPVSPNSQKLLRSPRKATRKISRIPFKVLDAPELQDDFYLNLVDWSSQNVLSVGLGSCVYLWSACTSQVTRLCDLSTEANSVTSVSWNERGNLVAVGTHHGYVQIWDVGANKQVSKLLGHSARVGALAWSGDVLSSGSRDRMILQRDVRASSNSERRLLGHRQEVCGLKWSPDNQHLASGGNDNRLYVWNMHSVTPVQTYSEHLAAVKAIAWSPHHHGLLASGGGTADRCIRFWNTLTGQPMQCIDTGSQVCNLAWSKHSSELVSTHGYSQNQILVWKYPTLSQVAKLTGHSYRVLYLAMSPDGEAIVTGAGDETLRFWNVFSKVRSQRENKSVLNLFGNIR